MEPIEIVEEDEVIIFDDVVGTYSNGIYAFNKNSYAYGKVKKNDVMLLSTKDKNYLDKYGYKYMKSIKSQTDVDKLRREIDKNSGYVRKSKPNRAPYK